MPPRLKAMKSLHRFDHFNKQIRLVEYHSCVTEQQHAYQRYVAAMEFVNIQGDWKSADSYGYIDLSSYKEALRHEASALEAADREQVHLASSETALQTALSLLQAAESYLESSRRRVLVLSHETAVTEEKRQFDQQSDLNMSSGLRKYD